MRQYQSAGMKKQSASALFYLNRRIKCVTQDRMVDGGQVYAQLQKAGRLQEIERELTEDRVFNWLLERNPVTTV